jgi:prepilin-type N-terminal cleavage/methylation domain-containing protein
MKNKNKNQVSVKGFTLVELLIAMAIFVMFTGIVIRSYADIVYTQRGTNEYRLLYSEARDIMDMFVNEFRENTVYFGDNVASKFNSGVSEITLISGDGRSASTYFLENGNLKVDQNIGCGREKKSITLNDERVEISGLSFYVTPAFDPYRAENSVFNSLAFHPKVTVFLKMKKDRYEIPFQTTVSLRNYAATPDIDITCIK